MSEIKKVENLELSAPEQPRQSPNVKDTRRKFAIGHGYSDAATEKLVSGGKSELKGYPDKISTPGQVRE